MAAGSRAASSTSFNVAIDFPRARSQSRVIACVLSRPR